MMRKFTIYKKGFTLIELLVVIGIIGILASLLLANFVGVRQRARDGVRKSDLRQIQSALELYRSDKGVYPTVLSACGNPLTDGVVIYMRKIPCDPTNSVPYVYSYASNGNTYSLYSCLENVNDPKKDMTNNASCTGGSWSYTLQEP